MQKAKNISKFLEELKKTNRVPSESIQVDGKIHRLSWSAESAEKSGWYVARYLNEMLLVNYGDWKGNYKRQWTSKKKPFLNDEEKAVYDEAMAAATKLREEAIKEAHRVSVDEVLSVWDAAGPASATHPYLVRKKIPCEGLRGRIWNGYHEILVALRTIDGNIVNLQRILPESDKFYWTGAQVSEVFWTAQDFPPDGFEGDIVVAEGMATAATVHLISGLPCFAAMNCGNLSKVAALFRKKWPKARLVFAADDDRWNQNGTPRSDALNSGVAKAKEAASGARDLAVVPPRTDENDGGTDWNDRYLRIGQPAAKAEWDRALTRADLKRKVAMFL